MTKEQVAWELRWQLGRLGIDTSGLGDDEVVEGVMMAVGRWSDRMVRLGESIAEAWSQAWRKALGRSA